MICQAVLILNLTTLPINDRDIKHLQFAKRRCKQIFVESPCLSKFIKVRLDVYRAICGPKEK